MLVDELWMLTKESWDFISVDPLISSGLENIWVCIWIEQFWTFEACGVWTHDVATPSCATLFEFTRFGDAPSLEDKLLGGVYCFIFNPSHLYDFIWIFRIFIIHQKWISRDARNWCSVLVQFWISSGEGLISQLFQADLHFRLGGFDWPRPLLRMHIDGGGRPTDGGPHLKKTILSLAATTGRRLTFHFIDVNCLMTYCLTSYWWFLVNYFGILGW